MAYTVYTCSAVRWLHQNITGAARDGIILRDHLTALRTSFGTYKLEKLYTKFWWPANQYTQILSIIETCLWLENQLVTPFQSIPNVWHGHLMVGWAARHNTIQADSSSALKTLSPYTTIRAPTECKKHCDSDQTFQQTPRDSTATSSLCISDSRPSKEMRSIEDACSIKLKQHSVNSF